jgi:hypothetical protein
VELVEDVNLHEEDTPVKVDEEVKLVEVEEVVKLVGAEEPPIGDEEVHLGSAARPMLPSIGGKAIQTVDLTWKVLDRDSTQKVLDNIVERIPLPLDNIVEKIPLPHGLMAMKKTKTIQLPVLTLDNYES